jgi:ABC-type amino acid transport substrate-binding protein
MINITSGLMKIFFRLIRLLSIILIFSSCSSRQKAPIETQSVLSEIKNKGVVNVGFVNYPPIVYRDLSTGKITGHFAKTIEDIFSQINIKVNFIETTWYNFPAGLKNHQFDICIAPTFSTIPRAFSVAFTNPLMYVGNSAICKNNDNRFKTLADFDRKGIVIAVTQGEQGEEYAKQNIKNAEVKVLSGSDQNLTFMEVILGRADLALGDSYAVSKFVEEHKGVVKDILKNDPYNLTAVCWSTRYNDLDLLYFLNSSIDVLSIRGVLIKYEQQFGANWLHPKKI